MNLTPLSIQRDCDGCCVVCCCYCDCEILVPVPCTTLPASTVVLAETKLYTFPRELYAFKFNVLVISHDVWDPSLILSRIDGMYRL